MLFGHRNGKKTFSLFSLSSAVSAKYHSSKTKFFQKKTWTVNNKTPFRYYTERKKNHGFLSWKEEEEGSFFSTWAEENKILGRRCWSLPRGDPSSSTRKTLLKISLRVSSGAVGQPGAAEVAHQPQVESLSLSLSPITEKGQGRDPLLPFDFLSCRRRRRRRDVFHPRFLG